jgi:phosphate/sulfate permease
MLFEAMRESLSLGQMVVLFLALGIAFGFEVINGFHDTANAVATVIYTRSLRPSPAVIWSGFCNFLGVYLGGIGVAYSIVRLLPVELLADVNTGAGLAMVMAILIAAIVWNFGTWYLALPASSSHTLIGAILGVGLVHGLMQGRGVQGVNWHKAGEVGLSLLISPVVGFVLAAALLLAVRRLLPDPTLHGPPPEDRPPPWWIRAVLVTTCTGVSFAHGSNDGQKGMGLILLIVIGLLPQHYALDMGLSPARIHETNDAVERLQAILGTDEQAGSGLRDELRQIRSSLEGRSSFAQLSGTERWALRSSLLRADRGLAGLEQAAPKGLSAPLRREVDDLRARLRRPIEYVPGWVVLGVALSLGIGTTVGWKRIVVTVAEKIGKSHLTYAQGACAESVAMATIGMADLGGLPVSTTHVLSSGVAGTMWANRSGLQAATLKKILLAWVLTLPAAMGLSGVLYAMGRLVSNG